MPTAKGQGAVRNTKSNINNIHCVHVDRLYKSQYWVEVITTFHKCYLVNCNNMIIVVIIIVIDKTM